PPPSPLFPYTTLFRSPNPAHPLAIRLLYVTIDEILEVYPSIDWITLWLNEHSFMGVDVNSALADASFNGIYQQNASLFSAADAEDRKSTRLNSSHVKI